jgi:hypothetical protein
MSSIAGGIFFTLLYSCTCKIPARNQLSSAEIPPKDSLQPQVICMDSVFNDGTHLQISSIFNGRAFNNVQVSLIGKDSLIYTNMAVPDTEIRRIIQVQENNTHSFWFFIIRTSKVTNGEALIGFREQNNQMKFLTFDGKIQLELFGCDSIYYSKNALEMICDKRSNMGDTVVHETYVQQNDTCFVKGDKK